MLGDAARRRHRSSCTRPSAATSSRRCSSSAGRPRTSPATSTARRTRSTSPRTAGRCGRTSARRSSRFWAGGSGVVVLPVRRRQDARRRRRDGRRPRRPRLILVTNTVSARQWKDELLRRTSLTEDEIGEYSGAVKEIRPVTIATYQVMTTRRKGVYAAPGAVRCPRLGAGHLRRGAPAAGADLPDDRRPAGPAAGRPHRDADPRGRPRGRRVLADRAEAVRRPVEGHRGAGLHRAGRVRRGAGDADRRRAVRLRDRGARGPLPARGCTATSKTAVVEDARRAALRTSRRW